MQSAEFATADDARRVEAELERLIDSYVEFENSDPNPWSGERVPPPLVAFGAKYGVDWPHTEESRFLLKGLFKEEAKLLQVDRMLFFWGGGFDLGGETLRAILRKQGAVVCHGGCDLVVRTGNSESRAAELAQFLTEEDFEDQFAVSSNPSDLKNRLFSLTIESDADRRYMIFDASGVQDWAFVSILPQLSGENPRLRDELDLVEKPS